MRQWPKIIRIFLKNQIFPSFKVFPDIRDKNALIEFSEYLADVHWMRHVLVLIDFTESSETYCPNVIVANARISLQKRKKSLYIFKKKARSGLHSARIWSSKSTIFNRKYIVSTSNAYQRTYTSEEIRNTTQTTDELYETVGKFFPDIHHTTFVDSFDEIFKNFLEHSEGELLICRFQKVGRSLFFEFLDNGIGIRRRVEKNTKKPMLLEVVADVKKSYLMEILDLEKVSTLLRKCLEDGWTSALATNENNNSGNGLHSFTQNIILPYNGEMTMVSETGLVSVSATHETGKRGKLRFSFSGFYLFGFVEML